MSRFDDLKRCRVARFLFIAGVGVLPLSCHKAADHSFPVRARADLVRLATTTIALPLSFEMNQGQSVPEVKYLARGRGATLFLTSTELVVALSVDTEDRFSPPAQEAVVRMRFI